MVCKIKMISYKNRTILLVSTLFLLMTLVQKVSAAMDSFPFNSVSKVNDYNVIATAITSDNEVIWLGSLNGLIMIRSGETQSFNVVSGHTQTNHVSRIVANGEGEVWASFVGGGVFYFNLETNEHSLLQEAYEFQSLNCFDLVLDRELEKLWMACDTELYSIDLESNEFTSHQIMDLSGEELKDFYSIANGGRNRLIVGTWGKGLYDVDKSTGAAQQTALSNEYINSIESVSENEFVVSTEKGVFQYSALEQTIQKMHGDLHENILDYDVKFTVKIGTDRFLLVLSSNGLYELNAGSGNLEKTQLFTPYLDKRHIGYLDTISPLQDGLSIAIGADESGFYVLPLRYNFTRYLESSLFNNPEVSMIYMLNDELYMGDQENLIKFKNRKPELIAKNVGFTYFIIKNNDLYLLSTFDNGFIELDNSGSIIRKNVSFSGLPSAEEARFSEVLRISESEYLLGTDTGKYLGVYRGNFKDGFEQIHDGGVIIDIRKIDHDRFIITSAFEGLLIYDSFQKTFDKYFPNVNDLHIDCLERLDEHRFFLCLRRDKALIFDLRTGEFDTFLKGNPLIRNIRDASIDKNGILWLTSSFGLYSYNLKDEKIIKISTNEGVKSSDFSRDGMFLNDNRLIIPGNKGIVEIDVDKAKAFLDFKQSQKTDSFITQAEYILDEQTESRQASQQMMEEGISLPHSNIVLKLKFSHNNFLELEDLAFDVRMLGLNSDWTTLDVGEYTTTYTTLPPGYYEFQVRVNDPRSQAPQPVQSVKVAVLPPWWHTKMAYVSYVIILVAAFYLFAWYRNKRLLALNKQLTELVAERTDTISRLLQQKQTFFANVSHEFRTPLSLIMGPLDAIAEAIKSPDIQKHLSIMRRNTNRLMRLVDQILDLAKFETSQSLPKQVYELKSSMEIMVASFAPLVENKKQKLSMENFSETKVILVEDSFEMIMTNLISNAIKYCPSGTQIILSMQSSDKIVEIQVADNGPGISKENLDIIFERFTRFDAAENVQGSGIGLALVKQLLKNNDGNIEVHSSPGNGTTFVVTFPLNAKADAKITRTPMIQLLDSGITDELSGATNTGENADCASDPDTSNETKANSKPKVLIVEDNADLRAFLSDSLSDSYQLDMAINGEQGLKKAQDAIPDLILSDVIMPLMDGYELANAIRSDEVTSHIPIVLITAKGDDLSRMKGWEEQVDDYISKPFKMSELKIRIKRLLSIRDILRKKHTTAVTNSLATKNQEAISFQTKKDADFFAAFKTVIDEHYSEEHFSRAEAAQYLNMVPRQLNRKLSALMDYNFSEYLRKYRLQKSTELLLVGKQVTEVAYDVGFNSPSYFSSCFKAEFEETPSLYVEKRESDQSIV